MIIRGINSFFNRHSRWLFGLITIVIIISFMGFLTPGQYSGCGMNGNKIGTIFDENVTYDDMQREMRNIQLQSIILFGGNYNNPDIKEVFYQLAYQKAAERRGVNVTDQEIADFIINNPRFMVKGKFNGAHYKEFLVSLQRNGYTQDDVDNAMRSYLRLMKLQNEIRSGVIVTENELENFYRFYNQKITLRRAVFAANDFLKSVKTTNDALQQFFADNKDLYNQPAQCKVRIACFEYDNPAILAEVNKSIDAKELKEFYENNKTLFTVNDAGGKSSVQPFESVIESVKINLRAAKSKELALNKAQLFAREVYDKASEVPADSAKIFNEIAAAGKIKVIESRKFTSNDTKIDSIESPDLVREAINVDLAIPLTGAVVDEKAVYVAYVFDYEAVRPAEYSEVAPQLLTDYRKRESAELAKAAAIKKHAELQALAPEELGKSVKNSKEFKALKPYSISEQPTDDMLENISRSAGFTLEDGALSEVLFNNGDAFMVFAEKREMPELKNFAAEKEKIRTIYFNQKVQLSMAEFQKYLLSQCKLNQAN